MTPKSRLAGDLTTEEGLTGPVTRQAQDRVTEPDSSGGLRGRAAAVPPRAAAAPQTSPRRERAAQGIPGSGAGEADPAAGNRLPASPVRARAKTPAGASDTDSPPAGSTALSGAAWRAAAKAAQSKTRRGRPAGGAAAKPAAKVTAPTPVIGGAALTAVATCLGRCDWTAGPGGPAEVDKAAERHTTKPPKHPTNTVSVVAP